MAIRGALVAFTIITTIFIVLAIAESAALTGCPLQFPKWFACTLTAHEGLAGGMLGAGGTIFAGWLAWTAVRWQTLHHEEMAGRPTKETMKAIQSELSDFLGLLNEIWRAIDLALLPSENVARAH